MDSSSTHLLFSLLILSSLCYYGVSLQDNSQNNTLTLESVREFLTRQEDSIVFCLIERAKYPLNSQAYSPSYLNLDRRYRNYSIAELLIRKTEAALAKVSTSPIVWFRIQPGLLAVAVLMILGTLSTMEILIL